MSEIVYNPNEKQRQFHFSRSDVLLLLGGKGSGKTYSLCQKMFQLAGENFGIDGGILCPTLKMFKRDVLPTVKRIAKDNNIPYKFKRDDFKFVFPESENECWVFHSEDHGESIAGPTLGWALINEVTLCDYLAYAELRSRARDKAASRLQIAMSGTPEEFEWVHETIIEPGINEVIYCSTHDNKHNLNPAYIRMLEETYDERMQQAYIHGKIVSFKGKHVAWSFDREKHIRSDHPEPAAHTIWVSLDFNVDPMCATLWMRMPSESGVKIWAFDEIILRNSNTPHFSSVLKELYGLDVTIYPDPAGNARSTKGYKTDIDLLRDEGFNDIKYRRKIRSVRGCMLAMNKMFEKGEILIHPKCKNLIKDLEQVVWDDSGTQFDKSNPLRTHSLDGAKDMCDYEWPILSPDAQITVRRK